MILATYHDAAAKIMIFKEFHNNNILFMDDFDQKKYCKNNENVCIIKHG